ncbi:hypothetical protein QDR37_08685 [Amnibacterium sp. CER49]|uniref:hypothetical protein n=1 Tax=Amnibacterium sp. CER49 TaxID=3039161 RepID=UPI00244BC040|nr:hypothetical protein [Amnibacterium sp. CER49]MDH2444018.1 hypothetical protein [Amnibacterium sp. CER49]
MRSGAVGRAGAAVLVAVLVLAVAAVIGVDVPHAVALGAAAGALVEVLAAARTAGAEDADWASPEERPAGGRTEVERLAWSLGERWGALSGPAVTRVERLAARRLEDAGLDPARAADTPAIEALLGAEAWAVLRPDRTRPVTAAGLDRALAALERVLADPDRPIR